MNKFVVIGDLHLRAEFLDKFEPFFNMLSTFDCPLIFLGDIFHFRGAFSGKFLVDVKSLFDKLNNPVTIIAGNHDRVYNERTILELFQASNIRVVNQLLIEPPYAYVAFTSDNNILEDLFKHKDVKVIFSHLPIDGHPLARNAKFAPELFKNFDLVFNGHWHSPKCLNNIVFTGSIYHVTKAEIGNRTMIYIVEDGRVKSQDVLVLHRVRVEKFIDEYNTPDYIIYTHSADVAQQYTSAYNVIVETNTTASDADVKSTLPMLSFWDEVETQLINYLAERDLSSKEIDAALALLPDDILAHWNKHSLVTTIVTEYENKLKELQNNISSYDSAVQAIIKEGESRDTF